MNKEFVPYEEALALKEFGFDEPCFAWYDSAYQNIINYDQTTNSCGWLNGNHCTAPTFSQAFRWFREKYDLHRHICYFEDYQVWHGDLYELSTNSLMNFPMELSGYKTYEEAELACLRKLIEIVKSKQ